jgi:cell division initiation protein
MPADAKRRFWIVNISPLDIRKQTFRTVFRGADNEEVRVFLDLVASEQEHLIEQNGQLNERIRHCEDRLAEYKEIDATLRNSVLTAERHVTESREATQREANLVMQEAEWRAKQMLEDARERLSRLSDEVRDLQAKKDAYIQHLRSFLEAQMELLGRNEDYLQGVNRLTEEVSGAMSRTRRIDLRPAAPPASPRPARPGPQPGIADGEPAGSGYPPQAEERQSPSPDRHQTAPSGFAPEPQHSAPPPQAQQQVYGSQRPQTTFPPARGVSRFARPGFPPSPRDSGSGRGGAQDETAPGPSGVERSEGLFEISADEEETPRP